MAVQSLRTFSAQGAIVVQDPQKLVFRGFPRLRWDKKFSSYQGIFMRIVVR